MTTNCKPRKAATVRCGASNAAPERRFVELAPGCYIIYIAGRRFMVDTELAARSGCSIAKERHPDARYCSVAPHAGVNKLD